MPRMLPSRPDADAPKSEKKVFAAFERQLPKDWTVFHSRRIVLPRRGPGPEGRGDESMELIAFSRSAFR